MAHARSSCGRRFPVPALAHDPRRRRRGGARSPWCPLGPRAHRRSDGDHRHPSRTALARRLPVVAPATGRMRGVRARRSTACAAGTARHRARRMGTARPRRGSCGGRRAMIRTLDPLSDPRWRELVQRDPRASAFHTPGWLEALRRTYGFVPVVYTTAGPRDELRSAIPFCGVTSWLTGRRLVSLPFSDHCEPLVDDPAALVEILDQVAGDAQRNGCRYIQVRPRSEVGAAGTAMFQREEMNYLYALDLRPDLDSLWRGINRNNHRGIRRAELGTWRRIVGRD